MANDHINDVVVADGDSDIKYASAKPFLIWGIAFAIFGILFYLSLIFFADDVPSAVAAMMASGGLFIAAVLIALGAASVVIGALRGTATTTPADGFLAGQYGGAAAIFVVVLLGFFAFVPKPTVSDDERLTLKEVTKNGSGRVSITMQHWTSEQWAEINPVLEEYLVEKDILFLQNRPALQQGVSHTIISEPLTQRFDGTYEFEPALVRSGEIISGYFKRRVRQSDVGAELLPADLPKALLCFRVPASNSLEADILGFTCPEDGNCNQRASELAFGDVEMCHGPDVAATTNVFGIDAYASSGATTNTISSLATPRWVVPDFLRHCELADLGHSFTSFNIAGTLGLRLVDADIYSYNLWVNGTPILVGGFSGEEIRIQIPEDRRLDLSFALGDLNFSGANLGYEDVTARFDFFEYGNLGTESAVGQCTLRRQYAALRQAPEITVQCDEMDQRFSWTGDYVLGQQENGYEVFVWSSPDVKEIVEKQERLNSTDLRFNGQQAVGVLRPPLGDNKWYALAIGFRRPSNHINFTFSRETAEKVLEWVLSDETQSTRVQGPWGHLNQVVKSDSRLEPLSHGYQPTEVGCPVPVMQTDARPLSAPKDEGCRKSGADCSATDGLSE